MSDVAELRDGSRLVVRPIRPEDAPALVALHERLSADTIYRRYFGARPHLAPAVVERFTRVEEYWRFALVALREPGDLVAVARYEGAAGSTSAELAMVVDDALQHRGVGRLLLGRLLDVARERGVHAIVADVLTGNAPMLRLLRATGLPLHLRHDDGVTTVTVDITAPIDDPARRERARAHVAAAVRAPAPGQSLTAGSGSTTGCEVVPSTAASTPAGSPTAGPGPGSAGSVPGPPGPGALAGARPGRPVSGGRGQAPAPAEVIKGEGLPVDLRGPPFAHDRRRGRAGRVTGESWPAGPPASRDGPMIASTSTCVLLHSRSR